jgi:hypothetical protein
LKNEASTDTRFTSRRIARGSAATSWPKIRAAPSSGNSSVESSRTRVDLPEPFWPRMASVSPRAIAKLTPRIAGTRRRPRRPSRLRFLFRRQKSLRSSSTSTAGTAPSARDAGAAEVMTAAWLDIDVAPSDRRER